MVPSGLVHVALTESTAEAPAVAVTTGLGTGCTMKMSKHNGENGPKHEFGWNHFVHFTIKWACEACNDIDSLFWNGIIRLHAVNGSSQRQSS